MQDTENHEYKTKMLEYNQELFESMSYLVDAVWIIDLNDETVFIMSDRMTDYYSNKTLTLAQIREMVFGNSRPGKPGETVNYFYPEFLKNLKGTFSYESNFSVDGIEHVILCYMTPAYDEEGNVAEVFIAMRDMRNQLYKEASNILSGAQMGLWYFILDEGDPKFVMDSNTAKLVGGDNDITPEQAYDFWFERVDAEYKSQVLSAVVKMRAGVPAEVVYPYHHPTRGIINIRCGGSLDEKYNGAGQLIKGYHQDITEFNNRLLKQIEMSEAIQKHFEAVFELEMSDATLRILSDSHNAFRPFINEGCRIDKAAVPIKYAICSHSKKNFEDITNIEKISEILEKRSSVTVEVESITMGWLRITLIPSNVGVDGKIEKCIYLIENIEAIKKQEQMAKKELDASQQKERAEREMLHSVADIYESMHVLDLAKHTVEEIKAIEVVHELVELHHEEEVQNLVMNVLQKRICEEHREDMINFVKLSDLESRLKGKTNITAEAIDVDNQWYRFVLIRIGSIDDKLTRVILASQNIDEDKRREERFRVMSRTDELTGVYNRHAYEENVGHIMEEGIGRDLWYIDVDINGLKATNDSKGHAAGDELIQGTADCLQRVFGSRGKVFRMGGDEFLATVRSSVEDMKEMINALDEAKVNWRGRFNEELSFSKGVVCSDEIIDCTVAQLEQESDKRMYKEKREYHLKYDRRQE